MISLGLPVMSSEGSLFLRPMGPKVRSNCILHLLVKVYNWIMKWHHLMVWSSWFLWGWLQLGMTFDLQSLTPLIRHLCNNDMVAPGGTTQAPFTAQDRKQKEWEEVKEIKHTEHSRSSHSLRVSGCKAHSLHACRYDLIHMRHGMCVPG